MKKDEQKERGDLYDDEGEKGEDEEHADENERLTLLQPPNANVQQCRHDVNLQRKIIAVTNMSRR